MYQVALTLTLVIGFGGQLYLYGSKDLARRRRVLPVWVVTLHALMFLAILLNGTWPTARVLIAPVLVANAWLMSRGIRFCPDCLRMHTSLSALLEGTAVCPRCARRHRREDDVAGEARDGVRDHGG